VRRFVRSENIHYGLYIARNRALLLQLLEQAMRDPGTAVDSTLLNTATSFRFMSQNAPLTNPPNFGGFSPDEDPRQAEIRQTYVRELAAGLGKRTGKAQTVTAMTVLSNLPKDPKMAAALLTESRQMVIEHFEGLTVFAQENLLEQHWNLLRDPVLIPTLKRLLTSTDRMTQGIHRSLLKRLIDLSPDEARPFVIREINWPVVDPEVLGALPDQTLPEVDQPLLSQLRALVKLGRNGEFFFTQKVAVAVRYATSNIYPDMLALYNDNAKQLSFSARASLLAYLAKQNERDTLPLIEQALTELSADQEFDFLPELTKLYYSDAIAAILRKRLESDEPGIASHIAYLISQRGTADDQKILEARLERWRKEWSTRQVEADTNQQGRIESELVSGLMRAKAWHLSPERMTELQQSCVTKICKQNNPALSK